MATTSRLSPATFVQIGKQTASSFGEDRVYRHAAALAYFTVFSLSPLLVVFISALAIYFGNAERAGSAIQEQIAQAVGPVAAGAVQQMVESATSHGTDTARPIYATAIALFIALWGASGLFAALQDSLNTIWGVMPDPKLGFMAVVQQRFVSFAMVLGVGFLLLVSLVLSTILSALATAMSGAVGDYAIVGQVLNFSLGLLVSTLLFAAIFKVLPDADLQWRDVWIGALVTGVLFSVGRLALGIYLGRPGTATTYGSAGALVVLLLWVNYAATILFAGAEFTKAYANALGSKIKPSDHAIAVDSPEAKAAGVKAPGSSAAAIQRATNETPRGVASSKAEGATVVKSELTPEKRAALERARRLDFEHTLSVVAGAAMVVMWVLRKRRREG